MDGRAHRAVEHEHALVDLTQEVSVHEWFLLGDAPG